MSEESPTRRAAVDAEVTHYSIKEEQIAEIEELKALLEANPESVEVREWLAFRFYTVGQFADAVETYLTLIASGHRPGVQHFHLGNAYYKMKRYQMALNAWKKTAELLPGDPKAIKAEARIQKVSQEQGLG